MAHDDDPTWWRRPPEVRVDSCDECGFRYDEERLQPLDALLRDVGPPFRTVLTEGDDDALRRRPAQDVWSALEYACHFRDVLLLQRDRIYVALVQDRPGFTPMYRDERVALARYNDQDPAKVADQIDVAADLLAGTYAVLDDDQLARQCHYGFPDPEVRTIRWIGVHTLHEGQHHAMDARRSLGG
jgi:S-DNA-T family DNA segregation ATPase FtsK/SpoIIIE